MYIEACETSNGGIIFILEFLLLHCHGENNSNRLRDMTFCRELWANDLHQWRLHRQVLQLLPESRWITQAVQNSNQRLLRIININNEVNILLQDSLT